MVWRGVVGLLVASVLLTSCAAHLASLVDDVDVQTIDGVPCLAHDRDPDTVSDWSPPFLSDLTGSAHRVVVSDLQPGESLGNGSGWFKLAGIEEAAGEGADRDALAMRIETAAVWEAARLEGAEKLLLTQVPSSPRAFRAVIYWPDDTISWVGRCAGMRQIQYEMEAFLAEVRYEGTQIDFVNELLASEQIAAEGSVHVGVVEQYRQWALAESRSPSWEAAPPEWRSLDDRTIIPEPIRSTLRDYEVGLALPDAWAGADPAVCVQTELGHSGCAMTGSRSGDGLISLSIVLSTDQPGSSLVTLSLFAGSDRGVALGMVSASDLRRELDGSAGLVRLVIDGADGVSIDDLLGDPDIAERFSLRFVPKLGS